MDKIIDWIVGGASALILFFATLLVRGNKRDMDKLESRIGKIEDNHVDKESFGKLEKKLDRVLDSMAEINGSLASIKEDVALQGQFCRLQQDRYNRNNPH